MSLLVLTWSTDIYTGLVCGSTMKTDMVLGKSPDQVVIMAPGSSEDPYWHNSSGSLDPGSQYIPMSWPRTLESARSLMAIGATDINTDLSWYRTMDINMALGSCPAHTSPWPQVASRPPQSPCSSPPVPWPQVVIRLHPSPYASLPSPWPQVASRPPISAYSSPPSFLPLCLIPQLINHSASLCLLFPCHIFVFLMGLMDVFLPQEP